MKNFIFVVFPWDNECGLDGLIRDPRKMKIVESSPIDNLVWSLGVFGFKVISVSY